MTVVEETGEVPEIEQNEGSDDDTITPDIEKEAEPGDDMQEEVPAEGDVEEAEEPTIDVMEDVVTAPAETSFSVTLPTSTEYTVEGAATASDDADYTFSVTANTNYRITAVSYKVGEAEAKSLTVTADGSYTIPRAEITGNIVISVTAVQTFKVTVTANAAARANIATLKYQIDGGALQDVPANGVVTVDKDASVKLTVAPKNATIDVTVQKGSSTVTGENNVYDLDSITADVTCTVTAVKNRWLITQNINKIDVTVDNNTQNIPSATIDYAESGPAFTTDAETDAKMIKKDSILRFKVNLAEGVDPGNKVIVTYKVGVTGEEKSPELENGVYKILAKDITDDITLKVEVRPLTEYKVTLEKNENITVEYSTATPDSFAAFPAPAQGAVNGVVEKVAEDSTFKFTVAAKEYYKITKVEVNDAALTPDSNGVYSFKVTKDSTIKVTAELDAAKKRKLTFNLAGDAGSATVAITSTNTLNSGITSVDAGKSVELVAKTGDKVTLTITPAEGYTITGVNGAAPAAANVSNGVVTHEITFADAAVTVTVTTDAAESEKAKTVNFAKEQNVSHLSYQVTGESGKVTKDEGNDDKWTVAQGAKRLTFTITATGSYKPTVSMTGEDDQAAGGTTREGTPIDPTKVTFTKTGATYDYVIPTGRLKDNNTITIGEGRNERTFTLTGDLSNVEIVASQDGTKISLPEANNGSITYATLLNDTLAFQITAIDRVTLKTVTSKVGENGKLTSAKVTNGVANVEVKATDNVTINITTDDQYVASKLKQGDTELESVGAANSYKVTYDGTYTASVTKGNDSKLVTLSAVKVLKGKTPVAAKEENDSVGSFSGNVATIDLSKAATASIAGQTLTVELYTKVGTDDVKVATYSLIVYAPATGIKINKKDTQTVSQAIDTTKTYTVTADKNVDLSKLKATKVDADSIIKTMGYADGILTVTMDAKAPAENAKAIITVAANDTPGDDDPKATIEITPVALITASTKAPAVKLVAATDISFKLALSAKTEQAVSENLYYEVVTTKTISGNDIEGTTKTTYVKKTGDSQNADVYVSDQTTLGKGGIGSYKVTASIVHANKAVEADGTLVTDDILGAKSAASKVQTLKTQAPAYEDKLKLKKINATVITGQKNVEIAEPQYSKYTTYAHLAASDTVKDLTYPGQNNNNALTVWVDDTNGKIMASATQNTATGKHKIQVTASAEGGAYASVATIDVTVVRGIHALKVNVPSTNLYKAAKKSATVKATAVYNNGWTGIWVPKNKSVKWEIEGQGDNKAYIEKMVTVKNGAVTVDKNFILDADSTKNTFKIKVTAANTEKVYVGKDDGGNAVVGYSDEITITSKGEDIKTIAIVQKNSGDDKVYIKALPDSTNVPATDINGGQVVVLKSGVSGLTVGAEYTDEMKANAIDLGLLTLKSSNQKNVPVYANGWIGVNKIGKVKLTVTANDGSKNKAELSLNIINDKTEGKTLGLRIYGAAYKSQTSDYTTWVDPDWSNQLYNPDSEEADKSNISFDASTVPVVAVLVQQKGSTDSYYTDAPYFANFAVSVKGGKIVEQWGPKVYVAMNSSEVTVKLTDKSVKDGTSEYVLKNTGAQGKPSFKALNKLRNWAIVAEQKADIEVTKLPADISEATDLFAKVEVDWSAKNAKNQYDLIDFAEQLKADYPVTIDASDKSKGSFTVNFNGDTDGWVKLNQKSYKLTVTLGTKTSNVFTAKTLPISMTVSVDKAQKFTFKPTTSYTLTTKDAKASAELTGKANVVADDYQVTWSNLQNMNTKGVTNRFTNYFEFSEDHKYIKLKKLKGDGTLPDKADCTGYITYNAHSTKSYYSDSNITNTVKITIKFDDKKTLMKYAQTKNELKEIGKTPGSEASVTITAGAAASDLSYAVVDSKDSKSAGFVAKAVTKNTVTLTWNGENALAVNKQYTVKLLVVPNESYYKEIIDTIDGADDKKAAIEKYGVPVSVKVKAVEAAASETKTYTVTVTGDASVKAGGTATYTATVKEGDTEVDDPAVKWTMTGATQGGTSIDEATGVLTVDDNETVNAELTITATYTPEGGTPVPGTKKVTVAAKE